MIMELHVIEKTKRTFVSKNHSHFNFYFLYLIYLMVLCRRLRERSKEQPMYSLDEFGTQSTLFLYWTIIYSSVYYIVEI